MTPLVFIERFRIWAQTRWHWNESLKLAIRQRLSHRYIVGDGLEIGALQCPLNISSRARARYVDRAGMEINLVLYPDIPPSHFVKTDLFDDGETLNKIPDESQSFIIANHFMEHTKNPLGTLAVHLRKLKPGGTLFYAVPDKNFTFDQERPITPFAHVLSDYLDPSPARDEAHYLEYAEFVDGKHGPETAVQAALYKETDNRLHFHVWDKTAILELFFQARKHTGCWYRLLAAAWVGNEVIVVLRKTLAP